MNCCKKKKKNLQKSFYLLARAGITRLTLQLGFHLYGSRLYLVASHHRKATTDYIKWTLIQSNGFFYLHCPSIISSPNLSLIAHTHTHRPAHTEAALWFTTMPLPKCPRCNYSTSNILTLVIGKSGMFYMPQSSGWEWLGPAPLSPTHTLSCLGWEHGGGEGPEHFASASITFCRVGGSDRTYPTWKPR